MARYLIGNNIVSDEDPNFESILKSVYKTDCRPLCMSAEPGIEMQISKLNDHFVIKRMPNKGNDHSPQCGSFETPPELSGLGDLMGTAIQEKNGATILKFDFPLSHKAEKSSVKEPDEKEKESVKAPSKRLSLRATLHYLWQEAGLNRWHPTMKKISWRDVYGQILSQLDHKKSKESYLKEFLYLPAPYTEECRSEIAGDRSRRWADFHSKYPNKLMLMVGEVMEGGIECTDYGCTISMKGIEDIRLLLSKDLYKNITRRFKAEIELACVRKGNRLLMAATCSISDQGVAIVEQITLMATTEEWIPFETMYELSLITRLRKENRSFEKVLRYNFARDYPLANLLLRDTLPTSTEMYVLRTMENNLEYKLGVRAAIAKSEKSSWIWDPEVDESMPRIPSFSASLRCVSAETPPETSGLGALLGTAIKEENGDTVLTFDFPLEKRPKRKMETNNRRA